jgi:hypothetical protein
MRFFPTANPYLLAALALLAPALAACGQQRAYAPTAAPEYSLSEERAIEVVSRVLAQRQYPTVRDWRVRLADQDPLTVDVRLGDSPFGIEWVSAEDRAVYQQLPKAEDTLQLISGRAEDPAPAHPTGSAKALVLILDHANYRYSGEVLPGSRPGTGKDVAEVEAKLEQDVRDFLEYVAGQPSAP